MFSTHRKEEKKTFFVRTNIRALRVNLGGERGTVPAVTLPAHVLECMCTIKQEPDFFFRVSGV